MDATADALAPAAPKRLPGGAILALLIVGAVVLIGPLLFVLALTTDGADSGIGMTINGVQVGANGQPIEPHIGPFATLGALLIWVIAESLVLAAALFAIASPTERNRTPFPLLLFRFAVAMVCVIVVTGMSAVAIGPSAEMLGIITSYVAIAAVVAMSTIGSAWQKVWRTILLGIVASIIGWVVFGALALLGLDFYG